MLALGVVYNPSQGEVFSAIRGHGSFLNGKPIQVSSVKEPSLALSIVSPPMRMHDKAPDYFKLMEAVFLQTRDVRRFGSAAQDLCYVACGRADAFYEMGLHYYDIAAGMIILSEAGGRSSAFRESEILIKDGNIVATNGFLHNWYLQQIHDIMGE